MKSILLASKSPRRAHLLRQINLPFQVKALDVDETIAPDTPPHLAVEQLALKKASPIAQTHHGLTIGSDTIVVLDNEILGKPTSPEDAISMLSRLSGRVHKVFTGVALILQQDSSLKHVTFHEVTEVEFGQLSLTEIKEYVATGSPMDKAGAYGIQDDWGSVFVKGIRGDYYTVVGFPLHRFYRELKAFAPEFLPHAID